MRWVDFPIVKLEHSELRMQSSSLLYVSGAIPGLVYMGDSNASGIAMSNSERVSEIWRRRELLSTQPMLEGTMRNNV
jgi:hypothetical protein